MPDVAAALTRARQWRCASTARVRIKAVWTESARISIHGTALCNADHWQRMYTVGTVLTTADMLLALRRLRRQEAWTRQDIDEHQSTALAGLRAHAYTHSPFYREFHAGLTGRPLNELPILTKSMVYDRFDEIVTDPLVDRDAIAAHARVIRKDDQFLNRYIVNRSSGTTSNASFILFNRASGRSYLRHSRALSNTSVHFGGQFVDPKWPLWPRHALAHVRAHRRHRAELLAAHAPTGCR